MRARRRIRSFEVLGGAALLLAAAGVHPGRAADPEPVPVPLIETSRSELVLIEVYARDSKGRLVRDLKLSDFTMRIDQKPIPKPITSLEWIEGAPAAGSAPAVPGEPPAGTAPGDAGREPPADGAAEPALRERPRRFLLFFEDSTSAPVQMTEARRAAIRFLEKPGRPSDEFGIAAYSEKRKLEILQEFTSDRDLLKGVLEKSVADNSRFTNYSAERIERREAVQRGTSEQAQSGIGDVQLQKRSYATEDSARMGRILNNMRLLVDALAPWPGYKAIIFIGEGVPEDPGEDFGFWDGRLSIKAELGLLVRAAGGSDVTLHSIQVDGVPAGDSTQIAQAIRRSSALKNLSLDTGGISLATNDLTAAFADVENQSSGYYLLSYAPQDPPDGNYHSVQLKVARRDVTLRFRRGFVRLKPEEARVRALQAAYVAPEMNRQMGLDLALVPGPRAGRERVFDLVLYVPPGKLLFLPQAGGPAARLEVGIVAFDLVGNETFRLARRVRVAPDGPNLADAARSGFDLFTRVRLPDRAQRVTAVVSDLQSGELGAVRVATDLPAGAAAGGAQGLSLYAPHEKSLWVEIGEAAGEQAAGAELDAGVTVGPALRTRFAAGEPIACGFRPGAGASDAGAEIRLVVRRGEEVVRTLPFSTPPAAAAGSGPPTLHADLATSGLADGDYVASVETTLAGAPTVIGRMPFRIRPIGEL